MLTEQRLSDVLSEFAHTLLTDFPIQGIACPDLAEEDRFPRFVCRAIAEGLVAVFTFPLRDGDRCLGALDLYRNAPGALDEATMAAAQTLADVTTAYLLNAQTRADLQAASERAREISLHDPLTGLANRTLLMQHLEVAVQKTHRSQKTVAILFVDLDRFKQINDGFGHHVGDELLVAVADRVAAILRPGDTMARLAGDEFVIVCEELDDSTQAHGVARRVGKAFAEPFRLSSAEVLVTASVGVAVATPGVPVPRQTARTSDRAVFDLAIPERLLREADTAMYQVKNDGGDSQGVVDEMQLRVANDRLNLSHDLRGALAKGELWPEYQPLVTTGDQRIVGAEALLRWSHPTLGVVGPTAFIPLAEQSGLIVDIGRAVLEQSCRERSRWPAGPGGHQLVVAVNVSPHQLMSGDFTRTVRDVLDETDTDPAVLTLEVTESALIQDRARALVVLQSLKDLGVRLALDDFGTGSSSLTHLRDFPVDVVKIDRSFVIDLQDGSTSHHIVKAVVTLGHNLGMEVVAEGVETAEQHEAVLGLGCDFYQGHRFAPSLPAQSFTQLAGHPHPLGRDDGRDGGAPARLLSSG